MCVGPNEKAYPRALVGIGKEVRRQKSIAGRGGVDSTIHRYVGGLRKSCRAQLFEMGPDVVVMEDARVYTDPLLRDRSVSNSEHNFLQVGPG